MLTASSPALPLSYRAAARASASSARSMRLAPIRAQVHPPVRAPSRCYIGATLPALPLSSPLEALFGETSSIVLKILLCVAGCETADLTSQTPEAEKQPESVQKVSLEQSSAPSAEMQSNIAAQDKAPQQKVLSENLQTGAEVVQFEVFGQTQEAINGAYATSSWLAVWRGHVA